MKRRTLLGASLALSALLPGASLGLASVPNLRDIGGDPAIMQAIFAAKPEYLDAAFARAGPIPDYFHHILGIAPETQAKLKARFLEA